MAKGQNAKKEAKKPKQSKKTKGIQITSSTTTTVNQ
jgi:hypothetical protein